MVEVAVPLLEVLDRTMLFGDARPVEVVRVRVGVGVRVGVRVRAMN